MNKTIRYIIDHPERILPILFYPAAQTLGVSVRQLVGDSALRVKAMKYWADNYPVSCAQACMDLSLEAEAFGAKIRRSDNEIPTVVGRLVKNVSGIDKLEIPSVDAGRTADAVRTIAEAKKQIKKPVLASVIGPFSLAGRLMDTTELMVNCYDEPEAIHRILEKTTIFISLLISRYKAAGADGIILAEPAAGLLSPVLCEEYSSFYVRRIAQETKSKDFAFIYHNCGNVLPLSENIKEIDADAYHFGNAVNLEKILKLMPKEKPVFGNISPLLIKNGPPEDIEEAVKELKKRCSKYNNFYLSSGCDIPPATPLEHIQSFFKAAAE
jgi:uroporphyrinogen decarboxylase